MTAIQTTAKTARAQSLNLMPEPADVTARQGRLPIDGDFSIYYTGHAEPRVVSAAKRFLRRLSEQTGIPLASTQVSSNADATLVVHCAGAGEAVQSLAENESYTLDVGAAHATLIASSPVGVLHGLETFLQLVVHDELGFASPAVHIQDSPRFAWRGLLLDSSRHWMPLDVIKRNLDGLAAVKMNVFHWHLSDDQGFRIESKLFPKLHELGSDGLYYTQDDAREVIAYARERGIRVVPEFDLPGHATSWLVGYPELGSAPGPYTIERTWGIHDPTLDPTREEVYEFIDGFVGEMAALFPDQYFHIGGDEVTGKHWEANAGIQAFIRQHGLNGSEGLQAYFNSRVAEIVNRYGKTMIGWDEILNPSLPKDVAVHSWRGHESFATAARDGHDTILSYGYYLDLHEPAGEHYGRDPLDGAISALTESEQARILGGEACMWTEYTSAENVDTRIWPRTAAIAERLWSAQSVIDPASLYRRMAIMSSRLELLGLTHRTHQVRMFDRLTGNEPDDRLRVFAETIEPAKQYARECERGYTSATPLNRLVDTLWPESERAREFDVLIRQAGVHTARIRKELERWHENAVGVIPLMKRHALLQDNIPLAEEVATVTRIGIEALDYLDSGRPPSQSWVSDQMAALDQAAKPQGELIIPIAEPVRWLVEMAVRHENK